jgi:aldose 1-epimerase
LYRQSDAVCLEPQIWPNAPNRPDFPDPRLMPGSIYQRRSVYRFLTRRSLPAGKLA